MFSFKNSILSELDLCYCDTVEVSLNGNSVDVLLIQKEHRSCPEQTQYFIDFLKNTCKYCTIFTNETIYSYDDFIVRVSEEDKEDTVTRGDVIELLSNNEEGEYFCKDKNLVCFHYAKEKSESESILQIQDYLDETCKFVSELEDCYIYTYDDFIVEWKYI